MPVRSIELKLARPEMGNEAWKALGFTHERVIQEAQAWMKDLLLLRGRGLATSDEGLAKFLGNPDPEKDENDLYQVSETQVRARLAETIAKRVGGSPAKQDEVVGLFAALYALMVPPVELDPKGHPKKGDSGSLCKDWLPPLTDPDSESGGKAFWMAQDFPWITRKDKGDPNWEVEAKAFFQDIINGKPPQKDLPKASWFKAAKKGEFPCEAFLDDRNDEIEKFAPGGKEDLKKRLKEQSLLAWFKNRRSISQQLGSQGQSLWDYLAFKLALTRLLSWESWNHRCADQHRERKELLDGFEKRVAERPDLAGLIQAFETWKHEDLVQNALRPERAFTLGRRALRNFDRLAEAWRNVKGNRTSMKSLADDQQARDPRAFCDPALVKWLLQHHEADAIWSPDGVDFLNTWARRNAAAERLRKTKEKATLTLVDPIHHPAWCEYESFSSNLKNYELSQDEDGSIKVSLPLLVKGDSGLKEQTFMFHLAPSAQMSVVMGGLKAGDKSKPQVTFVQAPSFGKAKSREPHETWSGEIGSAFLQFDRRSLESKACRLDEGHFGPAFLKLSLDIQSNLVEGSVAGIPDKKDNPWDSRAKAPRWIHHLSTGLDEGPGTKHESWMKDAQRILFVDLGVRTLGACVAFELTRSKPSVGRIHHEVPTSTGGWWGVEVEGSRRLLALPGEEGEALESEAQQRREDRRRDAKAPLWLFKRVLSRRRGLQRLRKADGAVFEEGLAELNKFAAPNEELSKSLEVLLGADDPPQGYPAVAVKDAESLRPLLHEALGLVQFRLGGATEVGPKLRAWDHSVDQILSVWRARSRRRDPRRAGLFGKSLSGIQYLEDCRKRLRSWELRAKSGQIKRMEGTFAPDLLDHIDQLKDDRIKEGANLLVNTARGLGYDASKGEWVQIHPPCHLIVLEDLNRYKTLRDRSRAENSQLMAWSHRALALKVKEMAEIFGIGVAETGAAYSSKFHAASGAPGVRVRRIEPGDLEQAWFKKKVEAMTVKLENLREGDWLPWEGGEGFATLGGGGGLILEDGLLAADLNAAGSLARRYLRRHGEAFKVAAKGPEEGPITTVSSGARVVGSLKQTYGALGGQLVKDRDGYRFEELGDKEWKRVAGVKTGKKVKDEESGDEELDNALEDLADLMDSESSETVAGAKGKTVNFFRDPSGHVLPQDRWFDGKTFWGRSRARILKALMDRNQSERPRDGSPWDADTYAF